MLSALWKLGETSQCQTMSYHCITISVTGWTAIGMVVGGIAVYVCNFFSIIAR